MTAQQTLNNPIRATGAGLLTGARALLSLKPGPVDGGIVFTRTDLDPPARIPARTKHVESAGTTVTLAQGAARIAGVEHLLSALHGLGIDNAEVEVMGAELPIMDGSAAPFVFLIQSAGTRAQGAERRFLKIRKSKRLVDGDAEVFLEPYAGCRIEYTLDRGAAALRGHSQRAEFELSAGSYVRDVSRARTFGFIADLAGPEMEKAQAPPEGDAVREAHLRHQAEFVKHKILDALGDLYLLGYPVLGRLVCRNSGHAAHLALLDLVLDDPDAFETVTDVNSGDRHSANAPG